MSAVLHCPFRFRGYLGARSGGHRLATISENRRLIESVNLDRWQSPIRLFYLILSLYD